MGGSRRKYESLDEDERRKRWRQRRWVHYPEYEEDNIERSAFKDAEWDHLKLERRATTSM